MTTLDSILIVSIFVLLIIYFFIIFIRIAADLKIFLEQKRYEVEKLKEQNQILERRVKNITTLNYWSQKHNFIKK